MPIPTEPIGSIPRARELLEAFEGFASGNVPGEELELRYDDAVRDTIASLEAAGSPVVTDGEQRKPSFVTYPIDGLENLAPDGVTIPFADGHTRQLPRLLAGPFRYRTHAAMYLTTAQGLTRTPLKQAVISASAIDPINPRVETPEEVRDHILEAAEILGPERLGSTDDCGFSPFGDDLSTARDTAFAKIRARVAGTEMASRQLGL